MVTFYHDVMGRRMHGNNTIAIDAIPQIVHHVRRAEIAVLHRGGRHGGHGDQTQAEQRTRAAAHTGTRVPHGFFHAQGRVGHGSHSDARWHARVVGTRVSGSSPGWLNH